VGGQRNATAALPPEKDPVPIVQEDGWAPGPVWTGAENLAPTGFFFYFVIIYLYLLLLHPICMGGGGVVTDMYICVWTWIRSSDRRARSESLYRLSYAGP
jgi:hypothetical protein